MKIIDLNNSRVLAQNLNVGLDYQKNKTPNQNLYVNNNLDDLPEICTKKYNLLEQKIEKTPKIGNLNTQKDTEEEFQNCRSYLLRLIAQKNYSVTAITQKAIDKDYFEPIVQIIVTEFIAKKWLNDERMANNIVEFYCGNKGQIWILQKLLKKQIPKEICQSVLSSFKTQAETSLECHMNDNSNNDYSFLNKPKSLAPSEDVKKLIERKYKIVDWKAIEPKIKNKIVYFLSSRGFVSAYQILAQWQVSN